jgi:hypothetical protein
MPDPEVAPERASSVVPDCPPDDIPVVIFPMPVVFLLFRGKWERLLFLARWHVGLHMHSVRRDRAQPGPLLDWPPAGSAVWGKIGQNLHHELEQLDALTHETLSDMSNSIRIWARSCESFVCMYALQAYELLACGLWGDFMVFSRTTKLPTPHLRPLSVCKMACDV